MDLVSIVIPCFNPGAWLLDAVASARAQTYGRVETILVNDGTDRDECRTHIQEASRKVDVYLEQPNRGPAAARNTGFAAARGRYAVPLDADDLLQPAYVAECMAAMKAAPEAAFVYTDCLVFGAHRFLERLPEYNLYGLLDRNFLTYAALMSKEDWERAGGYDESLRLGCEDWEFWLRLGARGRFGHHLALPLFRYRRQGPSRYDAALPHQQELVGYIQRRHPELYEYGARARVKARWSPAVCIVGACAPDSQTIEDVQVVGTERLGTLPERSPAPAFLLPGPELDPHSAEVGALAVWSGHDSLQLPDGSLVLSQKAVSQAPDAIRIASGVATAPVARPFHRTIPFWSSLHRHLVNAQLLDWESWRRHPSRSALRLIPLRLKERVNQVVGRPVFDLSFYSQFQPMSLFLDNTLIQPLVYFPKSASGRRRVALVTPHLGPGGAENVLLEVAACLCRDRFEVLLLATQSRDDRWLARWRQCVEHVYDLAKAVSPERMSAAVYSVVCNWNCEAVLVQNSLFGYAALPHIKRRSAGTRTLDLIHAVGTQWDLISCTKEVAAAIDIRVAVSESVRGRLLASGAVEDRIRVIGNGVDLDHFQPAPAHWNAPIKQILFVGRLDPVKRPLLLVRIARELAALRKIRDFRFVVAGDGPEADRLRASVRRAGLEAVFEFRWHVDDVAPLFAASDVIVLPSQSEGVPLAVLEALACSRPVVASNIGAVAEPLDSQCGVLIDVSSREAAAFAMALDNLLDQPGLRERMGAVGRKRVEDRYDRRRCLEAYTRLFDS
jgi:glycosyltransferase involved in cell wall biosynthesis